MLDGMKWGSMLNRVPVVLPVAGLIAPTSQLVCSMSNRSTCGVRAMLGGKCDFTPTGATKPGPFRVEFGSAMLGSDSTSRWVLVEWLLNWMVGGVGGACVVQKQAQGGGC